jgi:hypothetical protein
VKEADMSPQISSHFPHRINSDGSFDSICTVCLATIACVEKEDELAGFETAHVCNPGRIAQLGKYPQHLGTTFY